MPTAVTSLRSSYRRLEDDRRVTARSTNTATVATTNDTATATTAADTARYRDDDDIRCPHTPRDTSRGTLKTQVTHWGPRSYSMLVSFIYVFISG